MAPAKMRAGFTLLEIIIVIIIIGVLAGLALPRFFNLVEFSRSNEALNTFVSIRSSLERCYSLNNGSYANCSSFSALDLNNPANSPNAHFTYDFSGLSASGYTITATRMTNEGGDGTSTISLTAGTSTVTRGGTGVFVGIH